jgi:hypothetical protein
MNCAIPWAPAAETAFGLKFDSAISCAASNAAETSCRAAAASSGARYRAGTKPGNPCPPAAAPSALAPLAATRSPSAEQGSGPSTNPKCQASQAYLCVKPYREAFAASHP